VALCQFDLNESVIPYTIGATSELCSRTCAISAIAHCAKHYRVPAAKNVACIEPDMCPNNSDLNWVDYAILGHAGASQPRQKVWHRWSVEAGDRAGVTRTATAIHWSQRRIMKTSFAVCPGWEWRTHWAYVSPIVCRPTVKLLLLQTLCWNIFWRY